LDGGGDYVNVRKHRDDFSMEKVRNLRKPVFAKVNGRSVALVQVGYVAHALGRTSWTIKSWTRLGLFPEPPIFLNPDDPRLRRRLYPTGFVEALVEIANQGYLGNRLDRDQWQRFHRDVFRAYEITVGPLISGVATTTG
jgi:hypothetical protein